MQQQVNLRNKYGQLLDYMKEIGYKDSSIRYMYRTVQKILSVTETPSAEDYEFLINQQKRYSPRHDIRVVKEFDLEGKYPIVNYKRPLKEHLYGALVGEFALVRNSYKDIALKRGLVPKTVKIYTAVTSVFLLYVHNLGRRRFCEITEADIQHYFTQGKVGADQCKYIKSVLSDCSFLVNGNSIKRLIGLFPQMPRQQKLCDFLTKDEIVAIQKVILADDSNLTLRNRCICIIAMFTGLRSTDIANLKFESIKWDKNEIVLVQSKTHSVVRVPMIPIVGNYLYRYIIEERPKVKSDYVFMTESNWVRPIQARMIYNVSEKLFKLSGLRQDGRRRGLHLLRHNLAISMLHNGTEISVISNILGHKSPETIENYLWSDIELLRKCAIDISEYSVTNPIFTETYGKSNI